MGRLTLNVLLSFAQFEREVTGERIRDKIAASKAKGMWMGGTVPLGYDPPGDGTRALAVNQEEAEIVRTIFGAYIDLGSVHALQRWLEDRGIRSKRRVTRAGRLSGGRPFSRGALFQLLRNRVYRGLIVHKGRAHPGRHQAIIDADLFEAVQARLDANTRRRASKLRAKGECPSGRAPLRCGWSADVADLLLWAGVAGSIATMSRHRCSKGQGAIHPTQPSGAYPPHRSKSPSRPCCVA